MALFKKKTEQSNIPPELQQYYRPQQRQRMWLAWLVALISLVATISIVLGLFFGIRALIRKGQDNKQEPATTQVAQPENTEEAAEPEPEASTETDSSEQPDDVPEAPAPTENEADETPPATPPQTTPPRQTDTSASVPDTGPGDTAAIFIGVSAVGYAISALRRKFLQ